MIATAPDYVAACRAIVAQLSTTGPHAEAALLRTLPADERDVRAWMVCYAKLALVFMPGAEAAAPWWAFLRRVHDRALRTTPGAARRASLHHTQAPPMTTDAPSLDLAAVCLPLIEQVRLRRIVPEADLTAIVPPDHSDPWAWMQCYGQLRAWLAVSSRDAVMNAVMNARNVLRAGEHALHSSPAGERR